MSEIPRIAPTPAPSAIRPVRPPRKIGREPRRKRDQTPDSTPDESEPPDESEELHDDPAEDSPRAGGSINLRV